MIKLRFPQVRSRADGIAAILAVCLLAVVTSALLAPATSRSPRSPGMAADELSALFATYGDTSDAWGGGDRTASVPLPDGRILWLFSDTFLGRPNLDGSRSRSAPLINNSAVIQEGRRLRQTVYAGTAEAPNALVPADTPAEFHWIGDATVEGPTVQVLVNRYRRTGAGPLDVTLLGTALAAFGLPGLTPLGVRPMPLGSRVSWGSEIVTVGEHTYIYGTEATGDLKFAHVARVTGADLTKPWQFWSGADWSVTEAASGRLLSGVGTTYGVQQVGGRLVLVTHENNLMFSSDVVAYTAASPTGPFDGPQYLFRAPETGAGTIVYDADVHPELARPGKLLVSYNVNNLDEASAYADARTYRPRFVDVDWPRPTADPRKVPPAPVDLTATQETPGIVTLSWRAPPGRELTFLAYRRDRTAGQTNVVRLPGLATTPGFRSAQLISGHTYEYAVSAVDDAGEGPLSATVTLVASASSPTSG